MNRRHFSKISLGATTGALTALSATRNFAKTSPPELDRFGGWMGKKFASTGFFRVEKDDRWWLVTPEGNAFLSFGINHFSPNHFRQKHNRSHWDKILELDGQQDWGVFTSALRQWFLSTCTDYGFNTAGIHNSYAVLNSPSPALPYVRGIEFADIPHWKTEIPDENFVDIFAPEFETHCDSLAKKFAAPLKDDPYLLGYAMTDCPLFTEEDLRARTDVIGGARRGSRIGWPKRLRNLGPSSPGKQAYVKLVSQLYQNNINAFNQVYQTTFDSFDSLANAIDWRSDSILSNANETRDNIEFLKLSVDRYYSVTKSAIHRYDPNHLFLGDKLNANTDAVDTLLPITTQYTDILYYQMYGRYEVQAPSLDRWSSQVDTPIINGDSAFTMITETMPRPFGPVADSLEQRVEWTDEYFRQAFARPDFIGWH
ncbi:MAG: hypothetical protein AAF226_02860, partial [Verrucomicrobiota bacterium]